MSVRNTVKGIQQVMWKDAGVDGDAQRLSQLCWMLFLKILDDQDRSLEITEDDYKSPIPKRFQWRTWAADPEGITGDELLEFVNSELFPKLKSLPIGGPGDRRRVVRGVFEDAYNYMKSGQLMRQVINKITDINFNNLRAPATPGSSTRLVRSPRSWSNASTRSPAKCCSTRPAAPAASCRAPSGTCALTT